MYETEIYETILSRMLDRIDTDIDKQEGSLIYNALAPEAWELAQAYIAIDYVYESTFADTAPREELILRAKERGLYPEHATYAMLKGVFNIDIPIGSRFSLDELTYIAKQKLETGIYILQCEIIGTTGNKKFGEIIPIEFIEGLTSANITELLIPAEDEEDTEIFRQRYFNNFNSLAFGGNREDYIEKIKAISGVGGVKIDRVTPDNYNIIATIITSEYDVPTTEFINIIQSTIDPTQDGEGVGFASIGHVVNVQAVESVEINIDTNITLDSGYIWEDVSDNVNTVIDNYFLTLSQGWENTSNIIVRISQIESNILDVDGVLDISGTLINGESLNITLGQKEIPKRGAINANN